MKRSETLDTLFRMVANQRRRHVLHCLKNSETPMELRDLAEEIAVLEAGRTIDEIPVEKVKDIYTTLYHHHIPTLAERDMVHYQRAQGVVALAHGTKTVDEFEALLHTEASDRTFST